MLAMFLMSAVNRENSDYLVDNRKFHRNILWGNLAFSM